MGAKGSLKTLAQWVSGLLATHGGLAGYWAMSRCRSMWRAVGKAMDWAA
nr:hypothetical protein [uncultured Kingella sp.]